MRVPAYEDCYATGLPPCNPLGGTPAEPPAFYESKTGGGLGDTSPKRVRGHIAAMLPAWVPFAKRLICSVITTLICTPAMAAGSGMPWEAPLTRILESIEGPVAKVIAVVIIIVTGLSLAFGDMGGGLRRLLQIVFGLSIAFAATSFFLTFFSFAGGALID
jgi:type IV secretory pathway VirB2 component (pilin)